MSGLPCIKQKLTLLAAAFVLSLVALFTVSPQVAWAADDDIASGDCGTCVWVIDSKGTLTISPENGESGTLPFMLTVGDYRAPWYSYRSYVKRAVIESTVKAGTTCTGLFKDCSRLVSVDLEGLDVSKARSLDSMFSGCFSLKQVDLSSCDLSKVTSLNSMFSGCTSLTDVKFGGSGLTSLQDASRMFSDCSSLAKTDFSLFTGSSLKTMEGMFSGCSSLNSVDMSGLLFPQVTSVMQMFDGCSSVKNVNLSKAEFPKLNSMAGMFHRCSSLTKADFSDVSAPCVDSLASLFNGCGKLESVNLESFKCNVASLMKYMFYDCESLVEVNLSKVSAGNVQDTSRMFYGCTSLQVVDLSGLDCAVGASDYMFGGCAALATIYEDGGLSFSSVSDNVFRGCFKLRGGKSTTYSSSKVGAEYACIDKSGQPGFFSCKHLDLNKVAGIPSTSDKDGSLDYYECSVCGGFFADASAKKELKAEDLVLHAWGDYSSNGDATCAKDGTKTRTCSVCGKSQTAADEGSKLAHVPGEPESENAKAATCTDDGSHDEVVRCSACGAELSRKTVEDAAIGHVWGDYSSNGDATCTEDGTKTRECSVCGEKETVTDEGSKVEHKPGKAKIENAKEATCTADGSHDEVTYCEACKAELSRNTVTDPKLGHDELAKTQLKQAGISADGYLETKHVCKRCGLELSSEKSDIPAVKNVALSHARFTYSGKQNRPSIKVSDSKGTVLKQDVDYVVSYQSDGKDVGSHSVTIKGKGNYSFAKFLTFTVNPKGSSLSKVSAAKKAFTAKWSKQTSQTTGYQLRYSTKSSMTGAKTSTVKSTKTTSKKVSKLKKKTKYYVQVRTYKVVKGKTYYSDWSKVKSVKTK